MSLSDHLLGPLADEGGKKLAEGIKTLFGTTNNELISAESGFSPSAYLGAAQTQQNGLALREYMASRDRYDMDRDRQALAAERAAFQYQRLGERVRFFTYGGVFTLGVVFVFSLFRRKSV